jgi:hypothetical protein
MIKHATLTLAALALTACTPITSGTAHTGTSIAPIPSASPYLKTADPAPADTPTPQTPPTTGSLLVPKDIAPGNYWATPAAATGSATGYVAVCATYTCDPGNGMIENYNVEGRTMIPVPPNATMVNIENVTLTPLQ